LRHKINEEIQMTFNPCAALIAAGVLLAAAPAWSQSYPNKAIRLLVPQAPGGGNDTIARLIGQKVSVALKQQVAVDNRPGAGGLIAADLVAKSPPDGYTLLLGNVATLAVIPNVQKKIPYDPVKDFAPVSLIAQAPLLVVVHPSLPVKSIRQLIAFAKAKPGEINYASNGVGSSTHLATEMFLQMTGTKMVHVPYKGLSLAMTDLLSGQVPLMFSSAVAMMPHVKLGRLRALAMTGSKRSPAVPEIPTVAEAGVPDYEAGSWYGIVAPAGTPRPVIDLLNREIVTATKSREVVDHLSNEAVIPVGSTPEEFAALIRKDLARIGKVVNAPGAKFD
jgi:tripartite-type tricarboxylate transporter receptor subunit TctC